MLATYLPILPCQFTLDSNPTAGVLPRLEAVVQRLERYVGGSSSAGTIPDDQAMGRLVAVVARIEAAAAGAPAVVGGAATASATAPVKTQKVRIQVGCEGKMCSSKLQK
jgi:hypothetical protein